MAPFESCPQLCARQGITCRHEVAPTVVARRALAVLRVVVRGACGVLARSVADRLLRRRRTPAYVATVYRRLLAASGITVRVTGARRTFADPGEPVLVVGNHVSWLDVMAFAAVQPLTMVSKREIGEWPVVGWVARRAGTVFIDRERFRAVDETRKEVGRRLRSGEVVATFPEATTTCGRGLAPMFPAMFQAAIDVGVPVQPVAFSWLDRHGRLTTAGAYVGDQPLLDSVRAILGQRGLALRIDVLPRILPKHVRPIDDRKALRTAAAESIAAALQAPVGDWAAHLRPTTCQAAQLRVPVLTDPLVALEELPSLSGPRPRKAGAA
ncbi:lysophospholipid acyltransferase family protein [Cumulibacter manganitolerans]|uniref:lysophospholipid acyltransferase family protein n=1 Tax=Cumulibacter manganitolerans TaxID=1884992 RepID=UPI00129633D7|nr:lysophospholipid acyltransferase family protein [Cumulibacter manganitolerans]